MGIVRRTQRNLPKFIPKKARAKAINWMVKIWCMANKVSMEQVGARNNYLSDSIESSRGLRQITGIAKLVNVANLPLVLKKNLIVDILLKVDTFSTNENLLENLQVVFGKKVGQAHFEELQEIAKAKKRKTISF